MSSVETARRPVGRPRSTHIDDAVVGATRQLLAEAGIAGVTIEGVAARAGVTRATVYRRWPSSTALVAAVLEGLVRSMPAADLGDTYRDLVALLVELRDALTGSDAGGVERDLVAEVPRRPELADILDRLYTERRRAVAAVLRRGAERGDVRADLDEDVAYALVVGPVHFRFLLSGRPVDDAFIAATAHAALRALAPPAAMRRGQPPRRPA